MQNHFQVGRSGTASFPPKRIFPALPNASHRRTRRKKLAERSQTHPRLERLQFRAVFIASANCVGKPKAIINTIIKNIAGARKVLLLICDHNCFIFIFPFSSLKAQTFSVPEVELLFCAHQHAKVALQKLNKKCCAPPIYVL